MPTIQQIFGISGLSWLLTDDQGQYVRQGEVGKVDICGISRNNHINNRDVSNTWSCWCCPLSL